MQGQWVVRGVPASIENDGWWLSEEASGAPPRRHQRASRPAGRYHPSPVGAAVVLVALADVLLWQGHLGLSVALFALALSICMVALKPGGVTAREWLGAMAFVLACNLPMLEQPQAMSFAFSGLGILVLLVWVSEGRAVSVVQACQLWFRASTSGVAVLPVRAAGVAREGLRDRPWGAMARSGALPVGAGLMFLTLLASANPILENTLGQITRITQIGPEDLLRVFFWIGVACVFWPYLNPNSGWRRPLTISTTRIDWQPVAEYVNPASVRLSLIVFNALFAVQTFSDLGVLSGGVALPEGMTFAQYAHRGAYPLVAAALLAGIFALIARPMVAENRALHLAMYVWLGQTLFLVLTAAVRLGLYVDAYTLTHLRVAAFIWMALVFVGLCLTLAFIAQGRSLGWWARWNAVALVATLYICCFVNFDYLITSFNMAHAEDITRLDLTYLCSLGEQAIPAMMEHGQVTDNVTCGRDGRPRLEFDAIEDWREWGFRRWRLQRYLEAYHDL